MIRQPDDAGTEADALTAATDLDRHQWEGTRQQEQHEHRHSQGQGHLRARHAMAEGSAAPMTKAAMPEERFGQDLEQTAIRTFHPMSGHCAGTIAPVENASAAAAVKTLA